MLFVAVLIIVAGCQFNSPAPSVDGTPVATAPTPTVALSTVVPTIIVEPTPAVVELRVWGPLEFSPQDTTETAAIFETQRREFESESDDILLSFEPKEETGAAALIEYLRSASAVAPATLPDIIIFPTSQLNELAESQLLVPLEPLISRDLRNDLYPFAMRDTLINESWVAIPLTIQAEHGVRRVDYTRTLPRELEGLIQSSTPRFYFVGQGYGDGEMSNALLLQMIALNQQMPTANTLPDSNLLEQLMDRFLAATERGSIPRTVLSLGDETDLYSRLLNRQADWIESNSRTFLAQQAEDNRLVFTHLPTLDGNTVTIVEGYGIAITATTPRRQEAAAQWLEWLLDPNRVAEWNQITYGLPATRSGVAQTLEDEEYTMFVDELLANGWIRPSRTSWRDFARTVQEQFRAVMQDQITPAEFVEAIGGQQ
jgi:ABC-type glycerol-3-phosphate transport system substrate-binding protein